MTENPAWAPPDFTAGEWALMEGLEVITAALLRQGADPKRMAQDFLDRANSVLMQRSDRAFDKAVPLVELSRLCLAPSRWSAQPTYTAPPAVAPDDVVVAFPAATKPRPGDDDSAA